MLRWIAKQYRKIGMIAAVGSIILLTLNLSVSLYNLVAWRNIHPYIVISLFFICGLISIWVVAFIYVDILKMNKYERLAENTLNPLSINVFTPFQIIWWRVISRAILSEDKQHKRNAIELIDKWTSLGFIPFEDMPDDLKQYCIFGRDERI